MISAAFCELIRNLPAYFLVVIGVVTIGLGSHWAIDKLTETGVGLVSAGLFAFQAQRHSSAGSGYDSSTAQLAADPPASPKAQ